MISINGTFVSYFIYCKRRLWLHANAIRMEQTSDVVAEGKLLGESSYAQRAEKYTEVELSFTQDGKYLLTCKIDFYDAKNKIVHEVKKSDSGEEAHEWQLKFYLWMLKLNGIEGVEGVLEYPKLRETKNVLLTDEDITQLQEMIVEVGSVIESEACPGKVAIKFCKQCSYYEFCYVGE